MTLSDGSTFTEESVVKSLTVYVFNGATLEGYGTAATNSVTLNDVYTGEREIIVIANAPASFNGTLGYNAVKTGLMELTTGAYNGSLVMAGFEPKTLLTNPTANSYNIPIKRLVGRINIDEITVDFSELVAEDPVLEITNIYLKITTQNTTWAAILPLPPERRSRIRTGLQPPGRNLSLPLLRVSHKVRTPNHISMRPRM